MDLSASKLTLYQQCPAQYHARYVVPSKERGVEVGRGFADAGNVVHRALQLAALKRIGKQEKPPVTYEELKDLVDVALKEPKDGWKEPPQVSAEVYEKSLSIIKSCWKKINLSRAIMAEKDFTIPVGPIGGPSGRESNEILNLKGQLDLVNDNDDRIKVVDYKTGYDVMSREEAELDPQTNFYLAAAHRLFPGRKVEIEFHYLVRKIKLGPIEWSPARDEWVIGLAKAVAYRISKWSYWREQPNAYCSNCVRQAECKTYKKTLMGQLAPLSNDMGVNVAEYKRLGDVEKNVENRRKFLKALINKALETAEDGELLEGAFRARTIFVSKVEYEDIKRSSSAAAKVVWEHESKKLPELPMKEAPTNPVELKKAYDEAMAKIARLEEATKKIQLSYSIACAIGKAEKGRVDAFIETLPKDLAMKVVQVLEPTSSNGGYYKLDVEELPDPFLSAEPTEEEAQEAKAAAEADKIEQAEAEKQAGAAA